MPFRSNLTYFDYDFPCEWRRQKNLLIHSMSIVSLASHRLWHANVVLVLPQIADVISDYSARYLSSSWCYCCWYLNWDWSLESNHLKNLVLSSVVLLVLVELSVTTRHNVCYERKRTIRIQIHCYESAFLSLNTYYFVETSITCWASAFISTKAIGKMPMQSPIRPSAQLWSTRLNTLIIAPFLNVRQPSSSFGPMRKSYNALHCGNGNGVSICT